MNQGSFTATTKAAACEVGGEKGTGAGPESGNPTASLTATYHNPNHLEDIFAVHSSDFPSVTTFLMIEIFAPSNSHLSNLLYSPHTPEEYM